MGDSRERRKRRREGGKGETAITEKGEEENRKTVVAKEGYQLQGWKVGAQRGKENKKRKEEDKRSGRIKEENRDRETGSNGDNRKGRGKVKKKGGEGREKQR